MGSIAEKKSSLLWDGCRGFSPFGFAFVPRSVSIVVCSIALLLTMMAVGAVTGPMTHVGMEDVPPISETDLVETAGTALSVHSPISIDGNAGFTIASGVVGGDGSASDPYVIADWDIDATAAHGIYIGNADAYFVVRNCSIHDGLSAQKYGIYLYGCANGSLEFNTCSNDRIGIALVLSDVMTLVSNDCSGSLTGFSLVSSSSIVVSGNRGGIQIHASAGILVEGNDCSGFGILIDSSDSIDVEANDCTHAGMGILRSNNSTFCDNHCSHVDGDIGAYGIYMHLSNNNSLFNNSCTLNMLTGMSILESNNNSLSGNNCSSNYGGGMALGSSDNNSLMDNNCSSNFVDGISLYLSDDNEVNGNDCSLGTRGIYIESSNSNVICDNLIKDNSALGLFIFSGSHNLVWNNTFISNNGASGTYDTSHIQASDKGLENWWNNTLGRGNWWSDWQSPDVNPSDGVVDLPYNISGSAGAKDYYPLTVTPSPIPEFDHFPLVLIAYIVTILVAAMIRRSAPHP